MKHVTAAKLRKGQQTLGCLRKDVEVSSTLKLSETCILSISDKNVTRAEALWAMKVVASNYSFASCTDLVPLFREMFGENSVAKSMSLSARKISYVITYGLGPYFQEEIVLDLQTAVSSGSFFTLSFDEATTNQVKKQLDILVRFWSPKFNKVICGYLTSLFFGHADSEAISNGIQTVLETNKLPLSKILMLSMDGPNINLAVEKKLNKELLNLESPELLNLGTCTLHKVHGCFSKALDVLPLDVDELATDLFSFFKISAARREDFMKLEKLLECEPKFLLRHVSSRWLTLGPVVDRILSVYFVLQEYFLQALPKTKKSNWESLQKNARYQRIASMLKDPLTLVYLHFISSIFPILQKYLTLFQNEGPLIHLMYSKMNSLVRSIMLLFMKEKVIEKLEGKDLLNVNIDNFENYRLLKDVYIGEGARRALSHITDNKAKEARMAIRAFLVRLCKHLKEALPLSNDFLKDIEYLHPAMKSVRNENVIRRLCSKLKPLQLDAQTVDKIVHEWMVYKIDPDVDQLSKDFCKPPDNKRIDEYWKNVFNIRDKISGEDKFLNLAILVKNCLSLSHGNSDVERGFSVNNSVVTHNRICLSEASIISIRHAKDAIKRYGNICDIPVTDKLLKYVAKSHSTYKAAKEAEQKAEEVKRKRALLEEADENDAIEAKKFKTEVEAKIKETDNKIKNLKEDLFSAQNCLTEGNARLQKALKEKDFNSMKMASTMIEGGTSKVSEITAQLNKAHSEKFRLQSSLKTPKKV